MPNAGYALGVDVGGTKILAGAVDRSGNIRFEKRYPMHKENADAIEQSVLGAVDDMIFNLPERPEGVGLGLVGSVNSKDGVWNGAINIPLDHPVEMARLIREKHGLRAYMDNDVHSAALAEARMGEGKDSDLAVYISIGTGISSAILTGGKIIHGAGNYSGEMGHMVVDGTDHICKCGRRGCIEPFVSGGGLVDRMREMAESHPACALSGRVREKDFHAGEIYAAARAGDPAAASLVELSHGMLVSAVVNIVNFINPEFIILGGGALDMPWITAEFENLVRRDVLPVAEKSLKGIRISALDPAKVGLLGAGCVYFESTT